MTPQALVLSALAIAYPFVSHAGAVLGAPAAGLAWLSLILGASALFNPRSRALLPLALLCAAATLAAQRLGFADLLQRLPPVIIACGLAWAFGRTLLPGQTPLISRIGERIRGELPPPVARYGRALTGVWTLFFVLMAIECLLLGLLATPFWWSLFANFVNYALIALLIVLEYPIRRRLLRDLEHTSLFHSLRGSLRLDLR
jgi:uncharacterized membrane protein